MALNDYRIALPHGTKVFHINMLKRYFERSRSDHSDSADVVAAAVSVVDEVDEPLQELQVHTFDCAQQTEKDVNVNTVLPVELRQRLMSLIDKFSCSCPDIPGRTSVAQCKSELLDQIALALQAFSFRAEAIRGSDNVGADFLSRAPGNVERNSFDRRGNR